MAEIQQIALNAATRSGFALCKEDSVLVAKYSQNGRDAVNIVQTSGSVAATGNLPKVIRTEDIEFVINAGKHSPRMEQKLNDGTNLGVVNGLAVAGSVGTVLNIEAIAEKTIPTRGTLTVTGIVEEQELSMRGQKLRGHSFARSSIQNMLTILQKRYGINPKDYNIHINFPNSAPVDGPSAGVAILCAVYSAITGVPVDSRIAMTGEISIKGRVCAVGGVAEKVDAAMFAGADRIIIPKDNWQERYNDMAAEVIAISSVAEVMRLVFGVTEKVSVNRGHESSLPPAIASRF